MARERDPEEHGHSGEPGHEPAIGELAFLSDRRGAALVDAAGSVAWLCLPRLDSGTFCAKLLDAETGGHITVAPATDGERPRPQRRRYLDDSLVLETVWELPDGRVRVLDALLIDPDRLEAPPATLVRVCEGLEGEVALDVTIAGCFDYGAARPWIRPAGATAFRLTAGDDGLLVWSDGGLRRTGDHGVAGQVGIREGQRWRLALRWASPVRLDCDDLPIPTPEVVDDALERTLAYWETWSRTLTPPDVDLDGVRLSARVLHGLSNAETGAIAAAATTSLPESAQGRTWDYRASWVRDSVFTARSLAETGCPDEAKAFHRFILRTAAGNAGDLQILYGPDGERRLPEVEIDDLRGWRGIGPVRVGNGAVEQDQLDVLGELLNLSFREHERGADVDEDDWRFLRAVADRAARQWQEPDRGIWEWRDGPRHFVHSKALCWVALDRALRLADALGFDAPTERWTAARDAIRDAVDRHGVDDRGVFVQAFGAPDLDAAVLLLPVAGYCAFDDARMVATADAIREELGEGGLVRRYRVDDGQPGEEHPFLACSFWLAECFAYQRRADDARVVFDAALRARTDLGLFAEQADAHTGEPWGNFPQALTHLAHLAAAQALAACAGSSL